MSKITISCKLNPDKKQIDILDKTLSKCLDALNYISKVAFENKCFNRVALHHLVYYKVKSKYKLLSQIICQIRDKVAFSYKSERTKLHIFKNPILPLSFGRTISVKGFEYASISTISGRQKIEFKLGDYQKQMLSKAIKYCDSELVKRNNKFYLNITIEIPDNSPQTPENIIGVDFGINNIATCSTGNNFSGEQVQKVRNRYGRLRAELQSKRTPSARRHFKKTSGKERRFMCDTNHTISKRIIELANQSNSGIAIEDLKGIRKTARQRKEQKGKFHRWSFNQLRQFLEYKAKNKGIPVIIIDPAYTSKTCSVCNNLGVRSGSNFHCPHCSFQSDADINASLNISKFAFRVAVNQLNVLPDEAKAPLGTEVEGSYKPGNLLLGS